MDLNIKKIREDRNITQAELAEGAGLSRTTLSALENGGLKSANIATLQKIADFLKLEINDLFLL